eukprot:TRINITY_DN1406_c0_g1::TRINITY_DN1406_c0_g1_i1::g.27243::m.27243 TRINITY_DN1406_c0_g1::TRINITY_DN1406_c0_g1_i1::g.27243  ORF type:complete len:173 (+),score=-19.31,sp/Q54S77/VPS15_DICDI/42.98/9e-21 TRINITY_DN1406_c0_g1_i1:115-633(+)
MGNQLAAPQVVQFNVLHDLTSRDSWPSASSATRSIPNSYTQINPIGGGRFLKSILARHEEGQVVVKVYFKRGGERTERASSKSGESLTRYARILKDVLYRINQPPPEGSPYISRCPNLLPFQRWVDTERAGYLVRQYLYSNLYDRCSTRPFLTLFEKVGDNFLRLGLAGGPG